MSLIHRSPSPALGHRQAGTCCLLRLEDAAALASHFQQGPSLQGRGVPAPAVLNAPLPACPPVCGGVSLWGCLSREAGPGRPYPTVQLHAQHLWEPCQACSEWAGPVLPASRLPVGFPSTPPAPGPGGSQGSRLCPRGLPPGVQTPQGPGGRGPLGHKAWCAFPGRWSASLARGGPCPAPGLQPPLRERTESGTPWMPGVR